MNIKRIGFLGRLIMVLLLLSIMEQPVAAVPPAQEPTPPPDENVLFEDDFSNPGSGWDVKTGEEEGYDTGGRAGYESGVYFIISNEHGSPEIGSANRYFNDVVIDVDATQISAPSNNHNSYGVGCRMQGFGGYYMFISGDGRYGIAKVNKGAYDWLVEWQESTAIHQGNATNHIRAVCAGDYLALFVNGELLAEARDTLFMRGDVLLMATSYEDEPTEVHFDNFVATLPDLQTLPIPQATPEPEKDGEATPDITAAPTQAPVYVLEEQAQALLVDAMTFHQMGDYQSEIEAALAALSLYQQTGNRHNEATALQLSGNGALGLCDYQQALAYYQQALSVAQEIDNRWLEPRMLSGIGDVYGSLSDYDQALAYYDQALTLDRESDEQQGEAMTLVRIGAIYFGLSDYEQALAYYQEALSISTNDSRRILGNMGNVYSRLGDYEGALAYYQQALSEFETWGDISGVVVTLGNIGNVYLGQNDQEQALAHYEQALDMFEEIGDRAGEAAALNNIGTVYADLSDHQRALAHHQQALSIQRDIGDRAGEATTLNNLGSVYEALSDYKQALVYYQEALDIFREIGNRWGETITLDSIGRIHEQEGDNSGALEFYLQSIAVREAIRKSVKVEAFQIALAGQDVDVYQNAVRLLVAMGRTDEAFNLSERNRARAFLDALGNNRPDVRQSSDATLLHQEQTLHGELAALESSLLAEKSKSPDQQDEQIIRSIETQLTTKQQEYGDLLARLQLTNPELASLVTVPATTVTDTQALLDDQTTLVAYYLTDENILASILTHDDFQMVELPASAEEIARAVENFRRLGLANLSNPHPRSLSDLYAWLVAPLKPYLSTPKVGIIPHQALHYVPFAALSDGERYFGEQFILFQLPSASALPFIQAKTGREPTAPLVLGDPQTDNPDLPRLDHAAQEAEAVAGLFGAGSHVGTEASEGALSAQVGAAGAVHLAAHGSFNPAAPLFSRLWLAPGADDDGHLNVHEVYGLDLQQADLVVLSACQTQLGKLSAGDEVVGLNRAFLYGAPTVVASLWSVDDEATGTLMVRFYTHLLAGMGKAEALQTAQNEVRTDPAHPEWAHPYYWAAFVLSGDAGTASSTVPTATVSTSTPTPRGSDGVWVLVIALAAVLLLGLTVVIFIRVRRLSRR